MSETSLKHPWNTAETSFKHAWGRHQTYLKHLWTIPKTSTTHTRNIPKKSFKHPCKPETSQVAWPNLENEAWKAPGSPKWVLEYFLNKGVNYTLASQQAWPNIENETLKAPGSPKWVLEYFLTKGVNEKFPARVALQKTENETWRDHFLNMSINHEKTKAFIQKNKADIRIWFSVQRRVRRYEMESETDATITYQSAKYRFNWLR